MEKVSVAELLKKDITGKVVCFPTDTVYGVGAIVGDSVAIDKIYAMKKRDYSKPLAILTPDKNIDKYVVYTNSECYKLMKDGWPGALTLIFKKSGIVGYDITSGLDTVAFRMPNSEIALKILEHFGPLATTSVNLSGEAPINNLAEIEDKFSKYIDYLVIDKEEIKGTPSRIIDVSGDYIKVIRN